MNACVCHHILRSPTCWEKTLDNLDRVCENTSRHDRGWTRVPVKSFEKNDDEPLTTENECGILIDAPVRRQLG
ncbi:hypothetical protein EI42_00002 [Thermosporothrix hazakensis]|jgi:hypothetical protein|uniref:Uncharacterized protein n=1 Tax=Thermosporothrix hazakensis TaxID=644383 RepID=A0A326UN16_THEHA|nr:hypothetical protein EI42_00002 [Thermosporothrix hazakensis]